MARSVRGFLFLNSGSSGHRAHGQVRSRTAAEYSNVIDCERFRDTSTGRRLAPTTRSDLPRREFASRGMGSPFSST
jgi:hypothetical protein